MNRKWNWGPSDGTGSTALALHASNHVWFLAPHMGLQALPRVIPEYWSNNYLWEQSDLLRTTRYKRKRKEIKEEGKGIREGEKKERMWRKEKGTIEARIEGTGIQNGETGKLRGWRGNKESLGSCICRVSIINKVLTQKNQVLLNVSL